MWKTPPGFYCRIQALFRATIDIAQLLKSALYVNAIYSLYNDLLNREKRHQKKKYYRSLLTMNVAWSLRVRVFHF